MALHAAPKLFRRCGGVVGLLAVCGGGGRRTIQHAQPVADDLFVAEGDRRGAAGKIAGENEAAIQGICGTDECVCAVAAETGRLNGQAKFPGKINQVGS